MREQNYSTYLAALWTGGYHRPHISHSFYNPVEYIPNGDEGEKIITIQNLHKLDDMSVGEYYSLKFNDEYASYPNKNYSWIIYGLNGMFLGYFIIDRLTRDGMVEVSFQNKKGDITSKTAPTSVIYNPNEVMDLVKKLTT